MNRIAISLFALSLFAAPAFAASEMAGEGPAKPAEAAKPLIAAGEFAPASLLPPPPADGTAWQKSEMDELQAIERHRTAAEFEKAKWDNAHEDPSAFSETMGADLKALPETAKLLAEAKVEVKAAGKLAKDYFKRNRPWILDADLKTCTRDDPAQSSYPSGHSTLGYGFAVVLAHLAPEKAQAIMARANEYAYNRLVCSMHYRADIVAGQTLGTVVGFALLENPEFHAQFERAHAELVQAGVTK